MKLKFKLIHGKPNKDPNNFCLVIKDGYAKVVTHGRDKFIQIKCSWPGELEKMSDLFKQCIGEGFITTKSYLYIPSEWVYMDKRILYFTEEDDDKVWSKIIQYGHQEANLNGRNPEQDKEVPR